MLHAPKVLAYLSLFIFSAGYSQERMVYMQEDQDSKKIFLLEEGKEKKDLSRGSYWHLYPTISEDGNQVAYIYGKDQNSLQLMRYDLKRRSRKRLTPKGFVLHPAFSNKGSKLFFSLKEGEINRIAWVNPSRKVKGMPKVNFITDELSSYFPRPFQSGEKMIYQKNGDKKEIILLDLLKKTEEVIDFGMSPALSKDEKFVAYTQKDEQGNWNVMVFDLINKEKRQVTNHLAQDFSPTFKANGDLVYTSDREEKNKFAIYVQEKTSWMKKEFKEVLLLKSEIGSVYAPQFSGNSSIEMDQMPSMPGESRSSFGTIEHKKIIYVVGGHQGPEHTYPPESFSNRLTAYDVKRKRWLELEPKKYASHGFQVVAEGDYLYVFGGFAYNASTKPAWKSLSVVERYNIKTNSWDELNEMPRRRSSNVAQKVGNKVYLLGGWDATPKFEDDIDGTFHGEIDVFDLTTLKWETLETKLPKKRRAFSAFVKDQIIYLVGGISEGGSHFSLLDDFTAFDTESLSFTDMPKIPFATFAPAAGIVKDKGFMFGGMFKIGKWNYKYVPHIFQFDFKTLSWSHTGRYLVEEKGFSQVINTDGCLGILGGHTYKNGKDKPVATFEKMCL
ncbi:hypothetical protein N9N67_06515 [Bacteriovoracaceae bacterium]|nr:hypothetical protein [Bacteriovoracaceae bacterium]